MGEIGRNTWSVDNIVEGELVNEWACLEEKGQWLWIMCQQRFGRFRMSCSTCPIPPAAPATAIEWLVYCAH